MDKDEKRTRLFQILYLYFYFLRFMKKLLAIAMLPLMMVTSVGASPLDSLLAPTSEKTTITTTSPEVTSLLDTAQDKLVTKMKAAILKKMKTLKSDPLEWVKKRRDIVAKNLPKLSSDVAVRKFAAFIAACDLILADNEKTVDVGNIAAPKGDEKTNDKKMYIGDDDYIPTYPKYVYTGSGIIAPNGQTEILRRVKTDYSDTSSYVYRILDSVMVGKINLNQLQALKLNSLNVYEDRDYGYNVYVSLEDESINFYAQANKWPDTCRNSTDSMCYEKNKIKESEILSDDTALRIAKEFVQKYGVDVSDFGTPFMNNDWKVYYAQTEDKADYYFPTTVSVFYPTLVNGKNVYDEGGNQLGMTIEVDNRTKLVSSMYGANYSNWAKEYQETLSDTGEILRLAKQGGRYPLDTQFLPEGAQFKNVKLGTPTLGYVKMYDEKLLYPDNEILVPAYIFPTIPVTGAKDESLYTPKNVVVPLAKKYSEAPSVPPARPLDSSAAKG